LQSGFRHIIYARSRSRGFRALSKTYLLDPRERTRLADHR
jgi:hypothetical protein